RRQGRSRAADSAGRGGGVLAAEVHERAAPGDSAGTTDRLPVPDPPRRSHDAPGLLAHHQALCAEGGRAEGVVAAYAASCIRHPFAEPWRGLARGADAVGAQRLIDDADLY